MTPTVERVADTRCETGEGPLWHPEESALYWCDIYRGDLYRYDPASGTHERVLHGDERRGGEQRDCERRDSDDWDEGEPHRDGDALGGFTVQRDGSLALFRAGGRVELFAGGETATVARVEAAADTRFNDVVADPEGRVFAGTMPTDDRLGRLYRFDTDGGVAVVDEGFDTPNGMGFAPGLDTMYATNSRAHEIYEYDYDRASGALSNRRVFVATGDEAGFPDGLTVDATGDVWSARWDGGAVVRYAPDGSERERYRVPARKVTSATFGGPGYDDLYVTTACREGRPADGDGAGALFRLRVADVAGRPEFRSALPQP